MTSQIQSARPNTAATPEAKRRSSAALQKLRHPSPPFDLASYLRSQASPLVIVAHPDDEVLGVGAQLKHWPGARFIHVTDGAPFDMRDALAADCHCREDYASLRRKELESALAVAGFGSATHRSLGLVDQGASADLADLSRQLADLIETWKPEVIITHPYEGGHPDHDAVAFAVSCACKILDRANAGVSQVLEMTSYHNQAGLICTGEFLPCPDRPVTTLQLSQEQRRRKKLLLDCYQSQAKVLAQFQLDYERFRLAPLYDFSQPPHPGTLFYEQYGLGMTGERWRAQAVAALAELGLGT